MFDLYRLDSDTYVEKRTRPYPVYHCPVIFTQNVHKLVMALQNVFLTFFSVVIIRLVYTKFREIKMLPLSGLPIENDIYIIFLKKIIIRLPLASYSHVILVCKCGIVKN